MAKSKWKDNSIVKELLKRIEGKRCKIGEEYSLVRSFKGYSTKFNDHDFGKYLLLLKEQCKFDDEIPEKTKKEIINKSIYESADSGELQINKVSDVVRKLEDKYLKTPSTNYTLMTGVSIVGIKSKQVIGTPYSKITISRHFPSKFKDIYDFNVIKKTYPTLNKSAYSWVTINVKARCEYTAVNKALSELNYWLGCLNLFYNLSVYSRDSYGKAAPINKITKYPFYFIYLDVADKMSQNYWTEPNFSLRGKSLDINEEKNNFNKAKAFYKKLHADILKSQEFGFFKKAFKIYADALDSDDMNKTFLNLWMLLEHLTMTMKDNYDVTIERTLLPFNERFEIKETLNVIRTKRNMAIHTGEQYAESEEYAFMLMFIVNRYFWFTVESLGKVKSIDILKDILDLPKNETKLNNMREQLTNQLDKIDKLESLIGSQ